MTVSTDLPDATSSTLVLVNPTPEEQRRVWTSNSTEWCGALDQATYLEREKYLVNVPLAADGGITHWILVEAHLPPNDRPILGSCESLRKRALVRDREGGPPRAVMTHGIGSVFAPPAYRGRGYGSRMMRELGAQLATWQVEADGEPWRRAVDFSVLYSDIGKAYYQKFGWRAFDSTHFTFAPCPPHALRSAATALHADDLAALCARDLQLLHEKLAAAPCDGRTRVALLPDHDTMLWHHMREDWVVGRLFGGAQPRIKGAIAGAPGHRVWAIWTRTYSKAPGPKGSAPVDGNTLYVLRLVVEDAQTTAAAATAAEDLHAVLSLAQAEAAAWQLGHVELWNPTARVRELLALLQGGGTRLPADALPHVEVHREAESIPALRWTGDAAVQPADIDWVLNEKFGWC